MKVMIVGGTGFLGYHAGLELLERGYEVATLSLPDIELGDWFPEEIDVSYGNIFEMDKDELFKAFEGFDAMVYAVGPDDRVKLKEDAYNFFHKHLVVNCGLVVKAARDAGVKKCVLLGSYFAYFDRTRPELKLSENHPYIRCRIEQTEHVMNIAGDKMDMMVLELPYIFGSMPERTPLWKSVLIDQFIDRDTIYYPRGGTTMISVKSVAEAIVGAIEKGEGGVRYPIGDANIDWNTMLDKMFKAINMDKKIKNLPNFMMGGIGWAMHLNYKMRKQHSGLNIKSYLQDIQTQEFYMDASESADLLNYSRGHIDEAIEQTMNACYPELHKFEYKKE